MSLRRYAGLVRAALLLVGGAVFCWGVYFGATLPEPPPDGDGVPVGFAVIFVILAQAAGALTVQVGYALPAGTGRFRFGPLAARTAAVRAGAAAGSFAVAALLFRVLGWVLPESLPRVVSGVFGFSWLGAIVGAATGVALTVVLAAGTAVVRLVRGDPVFGGAFAGDG